MIRTSLLAFGLVLAIASGASAQSVRRSGPADPRYYPDLYKGPGWGYTLSEYYTFGNKADGAYGYGIAGHREGSNYDIQRWKEATGTDIPPGYYLQKWRDRRAGRAGAAPSNPHVSGAKPTNAAPERIAAPKRAPVEVAPYADDEDESEFEEEVERPVSEPTPAELKSSRRNATTRGVGGENSSQSSSLTGPEQSESRLNSASQFRRIGATDRPAGVDKN